jgi:hypothetical protein
MQCKEPNRYGNLPLIIVISSIFLLLVGIISVAAPLRVIYADDSSDQSQTDQSSPSSSDRSQSDQSSSQTDDSSDRSQSDQSSPSSSDQTDHSSSLQKCPPGEYPKHGFCLTADQKKKDDEQNNCIGSSVGDAAKGAIAGGPFGAVPGMSGFVKCFQK